MTPGSASQVWGIRFEADPFSLVHGSEELGHDAAYELFDQAQLTAVIGYARELGSLKKGLLFKSKNGTGDEDDGQSEKKKPWWVKKKEKEADEQKRKEEDSRKKEGERS